MAEFNFNGYLADMDPAQESYLKSINFPTFAEFEKNPGKLRGQSKFETIENGPKNLRKFTGRDYYLVNGYRMDSLEQCERILRDMGWNGDQSKISFTVNLERGTNGKFDNYINIIFKDEVKR